MSASSGGRPGADRDGEGDEVDPGADDAATRSVEALQAAAQEMISAARAMLDVADGLVRDPRSAGDLVSTMGSVIRAATRGAPQGRSREGRKTGGDHDDDDDGGDGGVQRIPVS